jgi:hypothetical protein
MVVKTFLVCVVFNILFFLIASADTLNAIENSHMAKYGSAESVPFCGQISNISGFGQVTDGIKRNFF